MSDTESIPIPKRIGRYRIERFVGKGGFGTVYEAWDEGLQRKVAIKVPLSELFESPREAMAFLREAQTLASFDHPHILPVYDLGSEAGIECYIVSKFIDGFDLGHRMRSEHFPQAEAVRIVSGIAAALDYAHTQEIIHLDVKPSNILLDENDIPYLCDFGIAMKKEEVQPDFNVAGTLAYMSPEQLRGEGHLIDGRSDIFSLGVVLYEMLTGRVPSDSDRTSIMISYLAKFEFDPPSVLRSDIPEPLERICLKALSPVIGERYQTAGEMANDLIDILDFELASERKLIHSPEKYGTDSSRTLTHYFAPVVAPKLLPKGLLPFDRQDHAAFLSLLPGPKDGEGLPESVRFWTYRFQQIEGAAPLRIGLLHGCSGSGKSSLVRAGILPRLRGELIPIYLDATQGSLLPLISDQIREHYPDLPPDMPLPRMLQAVRLGEHPGPRFLIVVDQLEQCFDRDDTLEEELLAVLRQSDGKRLQSLLVVRDEYWPQAAQFMARLEQPIRMGENCRTIEPFDKKHAASVMFQFGRALEKFPERQTDLDEDQQAFIDEILEELARSDQLQPVHLTLVIEMLKARDWTNKEFHSVGGLAGLGHRYLRTLFSSQDSKPGHRELSKTVSSVLECLTPADGSNVRGPYKTLDEIRSWVPEDCQERLSDSLKLLSEELKLIVPGPTQENGSEAAHLASYQLTHDYLVPAIREWLETEQERNATGRARQRLKEAARQWRDFHDSRRLPTILEFAEMYRLTDHRAWTPPEAELMRASQWRIAQRLGTATLLVLLVVGLVWGVALTAQRRQDRLLAESAVQRLLTAPGEEVSAALSEVRLTQGLAQPLLDLAIESDNPAKKVRALMVDNQTALSHQADIAEYVLLADPIEIQWLSVHCPDLPELRRRLADVCLDDQRYRDGRLRAASFLAQAAPQEIDWTGVSEKLATDMVAESSSNALAWASLLRPIRHWVADHVEQYFTSSEVSERGKSSAAAVLGVFYEDDVEQLVALLEQANAAQFRQVFPILQRKRTAAIEAIRKNLAEIEQEPDNPAWYAAAAVDPDRWPSSLRDELVQYGSLARGKALILHSVPLDRLVPVSNQLAEQGLHPVSARVRVEQDQHLVIVGYRLDEFTVDHRILVGVTAAEAEQEIAQWNDEDMHPTDLSEIPPLGEEPEGRFLVLGIKQPGLLIDSAIYMAVPTEKHPSHWGPLNDQGFVPRTNLYTSGRDGQILHSSIRWKFIDVPRYVDTWGTDPQTIQETGEGKGWQQADIRYQPTLPSGENLGAIWWSGGDWETECLLGLSQTEHQAQAADLADLGYMPRSLAAEKSAGGEWIFSSLWFRELPSYSLLIHRAQRRASMVVALLQLGEPQPAWDVLSGGQNDTNFRTATIHLLAALEIDPKLLLDQLESADDEDLRFCLLETLALYPSRALYPANRVRLREILTGLIANSLDPGELAMCQTVAQRHLSGPLPEPEPPADHPPRRWQDIANGHRMVEIPPGEFWMGSPGNEPGRNHLQESPIRQKIDRRFAIATLETTVAQFREFDEHYSQYGQFRSGPDRPAVEISWWKAQAYCRWLSDLEGIPESEMCYPPIDQINESMSLPSDILQRTGYRLPTEAEWEYACRAGTTTSGYFGDGGIWGASYAWTSENSRYQSWPVGSLLPNRHGLYDMHGNAREWCLDPFEHYPAPLGRVVYEDNRVRHHETDRPLRPTRGGHFLIPWEDARSAKRFYNSQDLSLLAGGFRIARTLPEE